MGVIRIEQGNEFKIITNFIEKDDLFLKQYQIAAAHIEEIVAADENDVYTQVDNLNNIIAFTGERGQGKSSAMLTFAEALENKNCEICFGKKTKETDFIKLDTIDPSTFENIHNIVEVIVAKMFNNIKNKLEDKSKDIINLFQTVYECLSLIRNPQILEKLEYDYEGSIQKIAHIGDSTKLKEHMCQLVRRYLEILGKPYTRNFLIIPIDDLDISIELAYKMAEQIRKYLLIPKVIIIMAVKIEQLKYCIELQYRKELDMLINTEKRLNKQEPIDMAARYIEKLIPDGRKINLPEIKVLASSNSDRTEIEYLYKFKDVNNNEKQIDLLKKYNTFGVEKTILGYIYEKTGLVFVKPENRVHPLVPNTLRELVNLISVLGKMDDNKSINNVIMFENYMLGTWIPSNLDDGYIKIIKNFYFEHDLVKHSILCPMLLNILEEYTNYTLYIKEINEFDEIKIRFAKKSLMDYSLGDVLSLLNFIEKRYHDNEIRNFVFAVKTLYSITMRKIVTEDRRRNEERDKDIYRFINSDIWGYSISRRDKNIILDAVQVRGYFFSQKLASQVIRPSADSNTNRAVFQYDINKFFDSNLTTTDKLSGKNLSDSQVEAICNMLFFSNFNSDTFISDNSIYRVKAEFSIDNLFISAINLDGLTAKWGFQPDDRVWQYVSRMKESLNIRMITDIVTNVEFSEYICRYCINNRDIKYKATDKEHLTNFVNNVEEASELLNYLYYYNQKVFLNEVSFVQANEFYNACFNATENTNKKTTNPLNSSYFDIKNQFFKVRALSRVCVPITLLNRINFIIELFENTNDTIKNMVMSQLYELRKLRLNCETLINTKPDFNIPTTMKLIYNSIYDEILKIIDKAGE